MSEKLHMQVSWHPGHLGTLSYIYADVHAFAMKWTFFFNNYEYSSIFITPLKIININNKYLTTNVVWQKEGQTSPE